MKLRTFLLSVFLALMLITGTNAFAEWSTGDIEFVWDAPMIPPYSELEYQLYLLDLNSESPPLEFYRTDAQSCTYTPDIEGDYLVGVNAIRIFEGLDVSEGPICWSDDTTCVMDGSTFYLKIQTVGRGRNDPITRWRLIWR